MTLASAIDRIGARDKDCCLTDSYEENNCGLDLRGLARASLTTIHGTKYQTSPNHFWRGKLCDRVIFGRTSNEHFLCAVELKRGRSADVSDAIDQIQGGLNLADILLSGQEVAKWRPLLVYSGSMPKPEITVLNRRKVSYKGRTRSVRCIDCGSSLLNYLNRQ